MQVPLIDMLNDLQLGFNSLQNPSQITFFLSISIAYNFCKWGAVILALVATFSTFINRVTIFIIRFRNKAASSLPSLPCLDDYDDSDEDDDYEFSNDDDDAPSSEFEEDEEYDQPSASASGFYFRLSGSGSDEFRNETGMHKRRRSIGDIFSLSEIANSESVIKLWDSIGFGLGLDFDDYEDPVTPRGKSPVILTSSPSVVVSAGEGSCGNLAVEVWDTRLRRRKPSVVAEWGASVGKTVRVDSGGVQKVYVRDDGRYGVMVGDMRNVSTPLGNVTESDADNWWDANAK
ncbi:hypothetical protein TanjilG_30791 [Lupinus angustifolius]|uniref:Uncharacterized protein n=1 Tax=Lupinus angustifolius TaxID=3871 RepID=A0A394DDG8_LUPAN|nr:PREDICTED: uncharacterized protein LOC109339517 [Lupinus angustifolius]OIW21195.1 hypothetical protein TanjilG_30791 [Lupinus angustifolius]